MIPTVKPPAENAAPVLAATKPTVEKPAPVSSATATFAENIAPVSSRFTSRVKTGNQSFTGFGQGVEGNGSGTSGQCDCGDAADYYDEEASPSEASASPSRPSHTITPKGEMVTQ